MSVLVVDVNCVLICSLQPRMKNCGTRSSTGVNVVYWNVLTRIVDIFGYLVNIKKSIVLYQGKQSKVYSLYTLSSKAMIRYVKYFASYLGQGSSYFLEIGCFCTTVNHTKYQNMHIRIFWYGAFWWTFYYCSGRKIFFLSLFLSPWLRFLG